jgi:hypothetical protein
MLANVGSGSCVRRTWPGFGPGREILRDFRKKRLENRKKGLKTVKQAVFCILVAEPHKTSKSGISDPSFFWQISKIKKNGHFSEKWTFPPRGPLKKGVKKKL